MGMTIEGCIRKPTKKNGEKIAAVDPGRIDSYNTSNVSLETARGGADTNRTSPADVARARAHGRNTIQKLKVDWIAPLHGVGNGYMPIVSVNLNPGHNGLNETHHYCPIPLSSVSASSSMSPSSPPTFPPLRICSRRGPTPVPSPPPPPPAHHVEISLMLYIRMCTYTARSSKTYERDSSFDSWAALSR